ncbi:MAG: transglycosylase SLT domain-containing protein [archaeon]
MEREEIFGAIIVLVIIVVITLIVINTHGDIGGDVRQIADEVFGWTKEQQRIELARLGEADTLRFIDRLKEIHQNALETQKKDCTYDLKGYTLPEKYKVEMAYLNSQDALVKFNLIIVQDEKLLDFRTIEKKEGWKLTSCFMEDQTKWIEAAERIQITYTVDDGLKAGTEKLYKDAPKFYKYDQNHICIITQKNEKYKKYFLDKKDCETNDINGITQAKEFFTIFMASVRKCKSFEKGEACYCEPIDFSPLPQGAEIRGTQEPELVNFTLYYNDEYITEDNIKGTKAGDLTAGFFQRIPTYKEWTTTPRVFKKESKELYVALTKDNYLSFATERAATGSGAFLRWAWAESLPQCKPEFYEVYERGCERDLDPALVMKTIKDNKYDEIIKEATQDESERELIAAIIATESDGLNDVSRTKNSAGLMQFTEGTAKGFSIECEKGPCYVCDPKGCNVQDNRAKPGIAIPAGLKLIKQKIAAIDQCAGKPTYREVFGIAAYNAGQQVICNAIKATGKQDPTWDEVKNKITPDLLRLSKDYQGPSWTKEMLNQKIHIIKCYPYYVQTCRIAFTGQFSEETQKAQETIKTTATTACTIETDKFGTLPLSKTELDTSKGGGRGYDPFNYPGCPGYNPDYYPNRCESIHRGMDIYAKRNGAPVLAIADGELFAVKDCTYILHIIEGEQYTSIYCHVKGDTSLIGKKVKQGDKIGTVNYNPPHIHLEIYKGKVTSAAPTSKYESSTSCVLWSYDPQLVNPTQIVAV